MQQTSLNLRRMPEQHAASQRQPAGLAATLTLAAMSLGYGVVQLDVTIVNTALNAIGGSLGGGVAELQWVVSAYTIAFAAFILTAGALGDRIGAKRIFMAGFAIFTAASVMRIKAPCLSTDARSSWPTCRSASPGCGSPGALPAKPRAISSTGSICRGNLRRSPRSARWPAR